MGLLLLLTLAGCEGTTGKPATPKVTISAVGDVTEGKPLQFLVRADPAPSADLTVGVDIASPGCELTRAPKSVKVAAGKKEATLSVPTEGAGVGTDGCTVTAKIKAGNGYQVGAAAAASANATVAQPAMQEPQEPATPKEPEVTITATAATVSEGSPVSFTLTASPAPATALTVNLEWTQVGSFLPESLPPTAIIPTSGTETVTVTLPDDNADEPNGSVTVTAEPGSGYAVGTPASATVEVTDDDPAPTGGGGAPPAQPVPDGPVVTLSVAAVTTPVTEGDKAEFTITSTPAPTRDLEVKLGWVPISDSRIPDLPSTVTILGSQTTKTVSVQTTDDNVDNTYGGVSHVNVGIRIDTGTGYKIAFGKRSATVRVNDND